MACVIGLISAIGYAWLSVRDEFVGNISDSAIYLVLSDFFSPYHDAPHTLGLAMFQDFAFPPLYPLVLALFGGGTQHAPVSYIVSAATMGAAVAAVYAWLRVQSLSNIESLVICTIFALLPTTLLTAIAIQSEPLYLGLLFGGFALLDRGTMLSQRIGALTIGLSVLARSIGIAAVAAVGLRWLVQTRGKKRFAIPVLALAPYTAWVLFKLLAGMESSYLTSVVQHTPAETITFLINQLTINIRAAWIGFLYSFDLVGTARSQILAAVILLIAVIGWIPRLRRCEYDAIYILCYLGIILLWPYPNHMRRFLQVLMPLVLFYGYTGLKAIVLAQAGNTLQRLAGSAYLAVALLAAAPSTAVMIYQLVVTRHTEVGEFARAPQWYMYGTPMRALDMMERSRQILDAMQGIDEHLPTDACVSSSISPFIPLYGYRRAIPVLGNDTPDPEFKAGLERCPYVFMSATATWPPSNMPPLYPYHRIGDQLEVIEVSLWEGSQTSGTVMTMLAKYRPH